MILYSIILFGIAQTYNIYPTFEEKNHWNLQELLGGIENPVYELDDPSFAFRIIQPINPSQTPRNHIKACSQIVTVKPQVSEGSNWLNNYLFLDTNSENTTLFYSQNAQDDYHTPYFNRYLEVVKKNKYIKCFDADYIDSTHFVIDCTDTKLTPYVDMLYIINTDGELLTFQQLSSRTNQINSRILRMYSKFGLRGSPDNSLIQVFEITTNNVIYAPDNINSIQLRKWFNLASTYTFQLVDFKIDSEGFLYILDKKYLFKCQIQENGAILPTKLIRSFDKQTAISFDINYKGQSEQIVGILFHTQFVVQMNTDYKTIIFSTLITNQSPQSIKLTNNYVMIQTKKQVLLYSIDREIQLYSQDIQQESQFLLNPYVPYYVQITNFKSQVGQLSDGILRLISSLNSATQSVVTIKAKSQDLLKSYQFIYSMIEQQDQSLYEMNEWVIFQEPIIGQGNNIQIQQFMSGPNIQYNVMPDQTGINLEFQSNIMLQTQFPSAQSIVYQDILQIDNQLIYQIFQLNNFELQLYKCIPNQKGYLDNCFYLISIHTYLIKMNKNKFQWWRNERYLYLVYTNDNYHIEIVKLKYSNPEEEEMMTIISPNLISQLVYSNEILYSLCENDKVINLYDITTNFEILDQINENNISLLGQEWNPKQIWTSNINSINNIIIIRNTQNIHLARYHNELILIKRIQINTDEQIDIAISKESFIIYRNNGALNQIEEYNIQDLSEIYLAKILPTYHHTLVSFIGNSDELLFMSSIYQDFKYILIYQFNTLSHNSLLREINASTPILSSVVGGQRTYLYVNNGNQHNYYLIMKQIEVNVAIPDNSSYYYYQTNKQIQISNQVTRFNHIEYIKIVNTMLDLSIVSNIHPIVFNKTNQIEQFNLGTTWYRGQATHFKLRCDQCENGIHLLNPINLINNNSFIDRNIKYITNFNDQFQVFLESNKIYLVNLDNQITQEVSFDSSANCSFVQTHPSQQYILVLCQSTFYLMQYKQQLLSILGNPINIESMSSMKFIDESWVLLYSRNRLYIYQLSIYQDSWKLEQFKQLDQIVVDYDVTQNNNNYAVVQTIDQLGNLTINYIEIFISEIQIIFNFTTSIANIIIENQQYQTNQTKFLRIQIETVNYLRQQLDDISFWIISSNVAHYRFQLSFDQIGRINHSQITGIINQYGDWIATGQMVFRDYSLIITYTNGKQLLHAYYHIPGILSLNATPMIGAFKVLKQDQSALCLFYKFNQLYLYAKANNNILSTYQIYDAPEIVLTLGQNLDHEQVLNISVINDYNSDFQVFYLDKDENTQNQTNYIWIIILIGTFLGLAVLLTLYVWRRRVSLRKQMDNPNNQIGEYSLMKL